MDFRFWKTIQKVQDGAYFRPTVCNANQDHHSAGEGEEGFFFMGGAGQGKAKNLPGGAYTVYISWLKSYDTAEETLIDSA